MKDALIWFFAEVGFAAFFAWGGGACFMAGISWSARRWPMKPILIRHQEKEEKL